MALGSISHENYIYLVTFALLTDKKGKEKKYIIVCKLC
jgi:hypothetical protein